MTHVVVVTGMAVDQGALGIAIEVRPWFWIRVRTLHVVVGPRAARPGPGAVRAVRLLAAAGPAAAGTGDDLRLTADVPVGGCGLAGQGDDVCGHGASLPVSVHPDHTGDGLDGTIGLTLGIGVDGALENTGAGAVVQDRRGDGLQDGDGTGVTCLQDGRTGDACTGTRCARCR